MQPNKEDKKKLPHKLRLKKIPIDVSVKVWKEL
jgi:hypothetical protein